jgi:hypothetical protein
MEGEKCRAEGNANDIKWPCTKERNGCARTDIKRN